MAHHFMRSLRQMKVQSTTVSPTKLSGIITGGLPYSAFNAHAKVKPEAMLHAAELVHGTFIPWTGGEHQSFLGMDTLHRDNVLGVCANSIDIDSSSGCGGGSGGGAPLYNAAICKTPLLYNVELEHVGTKSTQLKMSYFAVDANSDTTIPLFVNRVSYVWRCKKSRNAIIVPDWWRNEYEQGLTSDEKKFNIHNKRILLEFPDFDVKSESKSESESESIADEHRFRVLPTECGPFGGTNWTNYIRYCNEALGQRLVLQEKDNLKGLSAFFAREIKHVSTNYKKDTTVGDLLTVKVYPENEQTKDDGGGGDDGDINVFYFNVKNEAGNVVCRSKIKYFPSMKR